MEFLRESFLFLLPALPTLPDHPDALKVVLKDMTVVSHLVVVVILFTFLQVTSSLALIIGLYLVIITIVMTG